MAHMIWAASVQSSIFTQSEQKTELIFVFEGKHGEGLDIIHSFITDPNIDHEIAPESGKRFEYTPIELVSNNLMHEGIVHFSFTFRSLFDQHIEKNF